MISIKPRVMPGRSLSLRRSYQYIAVALTACLPATAFASASAPDASAIVNGGFDDLMLMKAPGQHIDVERYEPTPLTCM
jgi:hypothetical protein